MLDPWRAAAIGAEYAARGMTVVEVPQNDTRVVPASKLLYQAVVDRALTRAAGRVPRVALSLPGKPGTGSPSEV